MANNISFIVFFLSFENCSPCLNRHCSCYTLATVQFGARLDSNEYLRISSSYVLKMVKTTLNECSYSNEPFHPPLMTIIHLFINLLCLHSPALRVIGVRWSQSQSVIGRTHGLHVQTKWRKYQCNSAVYVGQTSTWYTLEPVSRSLYFWKIIKFISRTFKLI